MGRFYSTQTQAGCHPAAGCQPAPHFVLLILVAMTVLPLAAQSDGERQLETAVYRETVMGDVPAAIGMYQAILVQKAIARPVAARALWQLGQCQEKLGQRREAHATYVRVVRDFASESAIAAQARGKLAGWSDALPGPRNLRFEEGDPGKTPPGWFVPQVEKVSGSLAELRRKGCRDNGGCAVMIAPAIAAVPDSVGNLMQSFRAAAYRGKASGGHGVPPNSFEKLYLNEICRR